MRKIIELALFTDKVPEMTAFYKRLTSADPVYAADSIAIFSLGDLKLLIHARGESGPGMPPNVDHFAIGAADLAEAHLALAAQGVTFDLEPREFDWGRSAYLRDPDGRLVELHQA
jgi:catechol 2,3-dioxygenase-like lactoylglutathione lyase family enzyme